MKNDTSQELIERYLAGTLSDAERKDVEKRMASDPTFLKEVKLSQVIQEHLVDPGELHLRSALDQMRKERVDGQPQSNPEIVVVFNVWRPYLAAAAVLVLVVAALWWFRPSPTTPEQTVTEKTELPTVPNQNNQTTPEQKVTEKTKLPANPNQYNPTNPPDSLLESLQNQDLRQQPIAMLDPNDFQPNPELEARLGGVRGEDDDVPLINITKPTINKKLLIQKGKIMLQIRGNVSADTIPADRPLQLFVYSNHPADWENQNALVMQPLEVKFTESKHYTIDFKLNLSLKPGLYYLVVRQLRTEEDGAGYRTLWAGKFQAVPVQ